MAIFSGARELEKLDGRQSHATGIPRTGIRAALNVRKEGLWKGTKTRMGKRVYAKGQV